MKSITGIRRMIAAILAICLVLLTGCTGDVEPTTPGTDPVTEEYKLTFVVADKTNWDKVINIGDYAYTVSVNFNEDGTLAVVGTCVDRAQAQSGGQGGPGGSGGGESEETDPPETQAPMTDAEKAAQNFTKTGTWVYETGYGYTVTIDGYTTKTNWNKASGRHYFYAELNHNGVSTGLIQFQGKDSDFRKEVAADYVDFEERDAKLIFTTTGTTGNGNASSTFLYLENDGTVNSVVNSGSSTTYTRGAWVENADKSLTVNLGGSVYNVDYCDVAGKEGYRITYSSATMYYTLSGAEVAYTDEDFNGKTVATLHCAEQDYTLVLTEKGFAVLMEGNSTAVAGKYVKNGDVYTVTLEGVAYVSEGGTITVSYEKAANSSNTETVTRTFNLDGTVPEGGTTPPAGGEGGEGGSEGGEGGSEGGE